MTTDPLDRAIAGAATRVLQRRAAALRDRAAAQISTAPDRVGRQVPIVASEARVALGTAALLDRIAADLGTIPPAATHGAPDLSPKPLAPMSAAATPEEAHA